MEEPGRGKAKIIRFLLFMFWFLAALSSSKSLVVGPSVRTSVGHSYEKGTVTVSKGN